MRRKRWRSARCVRRPSRAGRRCGHSGGHVRIFHQHRGQAYVGGLSDSKGQPRRFPARATDGFGRAADVCRLVPFRVDVRPRMSDTDTREE